MHRELPADRGRKPGHGIADGQRCAHRAGRIVAMGDGRAEHGHDAVADMLVDVAAMLGDDPVGAAEEGIEERVDLLGVELGGERRIADEVGEQHAHLPPLALRQRRAGSFRRGLRPAARRSPRAGVGDGRPRRPRAPSGRRRSAPAARAASTALSANAWAYCSSPRPSSHAATSKVRPPVASSQNMASAPPRRSVAGAMVTGSDLEVDQTEGAVVVPSVR